MGRKDSFLSMRRLFPSSFYLLGHAALPVALVCMFPNGAQAQTTPFPLGVYVGNPDNSSASNEAAFEQDYKSFSGLMGVSPRFLVGYINQGDPISHWPDQQGWAAASISQSPAYNAIPVIGFPTASIASGSPLPDQQFRAFANGTYDSTIQAIVQKWQESGFKAVYWRIGWEMNLNNGPTAYAGEDAATEADWVAAFQHIASVLRQAGNADGITTGIIWNPGATNYDKTNTISNLYPGDEFVDIIAADVYASLQPYGIPGNPDLTWDWAKNDGTVDTLAQFIADPINRTHYWTYPAATQYSLDGSNGHNLSLQVLLDFAKTHGKPFAVPETGAGKSDDGRDVSDEAAFPVWLAQTLHSSGDPIAFVNIWYSNADGNYRFSSADADKADEAAAWTWNFGVQGAAPVSTTAWYTIVNANSKSCVDAFGWGTANGTVLGQWTCGQQPQNNQEWQFVPTDSGYYRIVNRNAPTEEIDVESQGTTDGYHVHLWQNYNNPNQQWMPVSLGGGFYKFVGRGSNRCLDVPYASTSNGVQLQIYDCNGTVAQTFQLNVQP